MTGIRITRSENRMAMEIGNSNIEISDYNIKSSADGTTELTVTIKGNANLFDLSANLEAERRETLCHQQKI